MAYLTPSGIDGRPQGRQVQLARGLLPTPLPVAYPLTVCHREGASCLLARPLQAALLSASISLRARAGYGPLANPKAETMAGQGRAGVIQLRSFEVEWRLPMRPSIVPRPALFNHRLSAISHRYPAARWMQTCWA